MNELESLRAENAQLKTLVNELKLRLAVLCLVARSVCNEQDAADRLKGPIMSANETLRKCPLDQTDLELQRLIATMEARS